MNTILIRLIASAALLAFCFIGGYTYGHHQGALAGNAKVSALEAAQADANAQAANAAQAAQAQADAAMLTQQAAALADAKAALAARDATVAAQARKLRALNARLKAIPSTDKAAATWLGPLPSSVRHALNPASGASS